MILYGKMEIKTIFLDRSKNSNVGNYSTCNERNPNMITKCTSETNFYKNCG